jgi:HSP20 family protein
MKYAYIAASVAVVQVTTGYTMHGILSSRGTSTTPRITVQRDYSCSEDDTDTRPSEQESVRKAFEDLAQEFGAGRRRPYGPSRRNRRFTERGPPNPFYQQFQNEEERKAFVKKQKDWINKAFDLASDLNESFGGASSTPEESKRNNEDLKNVRDWVNTVLGTDSNPVGDAKASSSNASGQEVATTDDAFLVSLDVPGVAKSDIDIEFNEDEMILTVTGTRRPLSSSQESVTFSKKFTLDETVDANLISAKLEMGVLYLTAPKKKPKEEEPKRGKRIPVM